VQVTIGCLYRKFKLKLKQKRNNHGTAKTRIWFNIMDGIGIPYRSVSAYKNCMEANS